MATNPEEARSIGYYPGVFEQYVETTFKAETGEYPGLAVIALFSLAYGIRSVSEFAAGSIGGVIQHFVADGEGLDGIVSCLAGVQIQKRRFSTAAFPILLETWKGLRDFKKGKGLSKQNISRNALFFLGFGLSYARYV